MDSMAQGLFGLDFFTTSPKLFKKIKKYGRIKNKTLENGF
jgi:hypothetical protein